MGQLVDWDAAYRTAAGPPWNIGEPQPDVAALIAAGRFGSPVLDAGCGVGEVSLALAAQGHTVVGVDISAAAIAAASAAASRLARAREVTFVHADITSWSGYDGYFATIVDSGLFHVLPPGSRDVYLGSLRRCAAPGAALFMLAFAESAAGGPGPHQFTSDQLRQSVARYWQIDEVRPAHLYGRGGAARAAANAPATGGTDHHGRVKMPAHLVIAHRAH
jgi:SAM-dependent methyltransferase